MTHRPWHKGKGIRDITYDKELGWQIDDRTWSSEYPFLSKVLGLQYKERFEQFKKDFKNTPSPSRSLVSRNIAALSKSPLVQKELPEALGKAGERVKKWGSGFFEGDRTSYGGMSGFDEIVKLKNEQDLARARALFDRDAKMTQREMNLLTANATENELEKIEQQKALNTKENTANEDPNEKETTVLKSQEKVDSNRMTDKEVQALSQEKGSQAVEVYITPEGTASRTISPEEMKGKASLITLTDEDVKKQEEKNKGWTSGFGDWAKDHFSAKNMAKGALGGAADYINYWSRYM
tara:strand:- start:1663 stop:2544 length:882 start_codon:yes stop_codon:yes gene_type:complete